MAMAVETAVGEGATVGKVVASSVPGQRLGVERSVRVSKMPFSWRDVDGRSQVAEDDLSLPVAVVDGLEAA